MSARFLPVARKEFREMRRDPITLWIAAFLPVVMLFLFGYAVSLDVEDVPVAVLDRDRSAASARLVEALENSGDFSVRHRAADEREVRRLLDAGRARLVVVIPAGFAEDLTSGRRARVQTLVDATYSATAAVVRDGVEALLVDFARRQAASQAGPGGGAAHPAGGIRVRPRVRYNPSLESATFVIPGLFAVILLAFPPLLTVLGVVREKESGSIQQVYVSPLRPWEFLAGKALPYAAIAFGELATVVALGVWWFDVPFRGSPLLLLAASILYVLCTVGIGLFVSTLTRSQVVGMLLALVITLMPAFLFSGFMFPISAMPEPVQWYTRLFPGRYFTEISRGLFLKGSGPAALATPLLLLAAYTAAVFGAATLRLGRKLA
jgi:ABC-2 type transport system permease protein